LFKTGDYVKWHKCIYKAYRELKQIIVKELPENKVLIQRWHPSKRRFVSASVCTSELTPTTKPINECKNHFWGKDNGALESVKRKYCQICTMKQECEYVMP